MLHAKPSEEGTESIRDGETVGTVRLGQQEVPLIKGRNVFDAFAEYFGERFEKSRVYHTWKKQPLVSGSIRYPGSTRRFRAHLYTLRLGESKEAEQIEVRYTHRVGGLRIWAVE